MRSRSLGLGVLFWSWSVPRQLRFSNKKRAGKALESWKGATFAAALLFNPPQSLLDQDASPRRSHPENSLSACYRNCRSTPPTSLGRPAGKRPGAVPLPARRPSSFPVLCQYLRIHAILLARLSPPLRSSKVPPTDAHLTARQDSPTPTSHFRNIVSRLLPFCTPSNHPPLSRERSPRRQASFGALRQFCPLRRNNETPA